MFDHDTLHHARRLLANGWRMRAVARQLGVPTGVVKRALSHPAAR